MKLAFTTLMFALSATITFGQELIPESLTPSEHNEFGDPITNVIDADGAKQGDWTYQDSYEKPILKETYENHVLKGVYYSILNSNGTIDWKISTEWSANLELSEKLKQIVTDKHGELAENQQIVVLFNAEGRMIRFATLGNWNDADSQKLEKAVRKSLKNNQISISDETFILL